MSLHVGFMSFEDYRRLTRDKTPEGMNARSYGKRPELGSGLLPKPGERKK